MVRCNRRLREEVFRSLPFWEEFATVEQHSRLAMFHLTQGFQQAELEKQVLKPYLNHQPDAKQRWR